MAYMDEMMLSPPSDTITHEAWQQTPVSVKSWIGEAGAEIKQLHETVEQLQEIVNRNSRNSSQPPSQDRPEQKPGKEPSGPPRKRGGQPGHRGHHRELVEGWS
jgi:transposase